jgi:hypothetical protein
MTAYRPAETVRQLLNAAYTSPAATAEIVRQILDDADDVDVVLVALAVIAAGAVDVTAHSTGAPFDVALRRLLGAIPGPDPGTDPDLGL